MKKRTDVSHPLKMFLFNTGVKMFFVSEQGGVTTLSQPQTLRAFQFVNHKPGKSKFKRNA